MAAINLPYAELLRDPRWQRKRLEIMKRDDFACRWCHDKDSELQVDHKCYRRGARPWEYDDADLVTLCKKCHAKITGYRRQAMDLLGEFNVYELPLVIAQIEALLPGATHSQSVQSQADIRAIEAEKELWISRPWTKEASRRVDELDAQLSQFWDAVAQEAAT